MGDRLKEKVALVSGAGSSGPGWGNGKATAVLFAREGAKVLAADLNLDAAVETKRIIESEGGICEVVAGNVSRADDVATIVDACITAFGRIDVLHNNVGIVEVGGPVETSEESWDRVNDVNLKSMFLTCKQVLPHMERQGNGAIVNIASVSGIRANTILPGMMNTPMVHTAEVIAAYGGSAERWSAVVTRSVQWDAWAMLGTSRTQLCSLRLTRPNTLPALSWSSTAGSPSTASEHRFG